MDTQLLDFSLHALSTFAIACSKPIHNMVYCRWLVRSTDLPRVYLGKVTLMVKSDFLQRRVSLYLFGLTCVLLSSSSLLSSLELSDEKVYEP